MICESNAELRLTVHWQEPLSHEIDLIACCYKNNEILKQYTYQQLYNIKNLYNEIKQYYVKPKNHNYKIWQLCHTNELNCDPFNETPKNIVVSLDRTCNLNCIMCGSKTLNNEVLTMLQYKLLNELIGYNNNLDSIQPTSDGEPFFYKNDMFSWLKKLSTVDTKTVKFISNLTMLNDIDIDMLLKLRDIKGINFSFTASIDGITAETYKKIRQNNLFDKVIHNAETLNKYNMLKKVSFVVMPENLIEFPHIFDFWNDKNINVTPILINDYCHPIKNAKDIVLNSTEWKNFIMQEYRQ